MSPAAVPEGIAELVEQWGYLALGVGVALGLPVTEDIWLPAGGYLARTGMLSLPGVLGAGLAGAVIADNLGYWMGRMGGRPLLDRLGRYLLLTPARLHRAETFFERYGEAAVFFARFVAWLRFSAGPLAGVSRMPFPRFFAYNLCASVLWVPAMVIVGYVFAPQLNRVLGVVWRAREVTVAVAILLVVLWAVRAGLRRAGGSSAAGDEALAEARRSSGAWEPT